MTKASLIALRQHEDQKIKNLNRGYGELKSKILVIIEVAKNCQHACRCIAVDRYDGGRFCQWTHYSEFLSLAVFSFLLL